jgi:hypothetical protein
MSTPHGNVLFSMIPMDQLKMVMYNVKHTCMTYSRDSSTGKRNAVPWIKENLIPVSTVLRDVMRKQYSFKHVSKVNNDFVLR